MKAVLVIDIPNSCAECPLMLWDSLSEYYGACVPTLKEENCITDSYQENEDKGTVPSWCPLRPLPLSATESDYAMKKCFDKALAEDWMSFEEGWNACLDEIVGETE